MSNSLWSKTDTSLISLTLNFTYHLWRSSQPLYHMLLECSCWIASRAARAHYLVCMQVKASRLFRLLRGSSAVLWMDEWDENSIKGVYASFGVEWWADWAEGWLLLCSCWSCVVLMRDVLLHLFHFYKTGCLSQFTGRLPAFIGMCTPANCSSLLYTSQIYYFKAKLLLKIVLISIFLIRKLI